MATLVATGGLLATGTHPADARAALSATGYCNSGDLCAWRHDAEGGGILDTPYAEDDYDGDYVQYWASAIPVNDDLSSVRNRYNSYPVDLFEHDHYAGTTECFARQMTSYRNIKDGLEDEASSHKGMAVGTC
jgi:hypothetical protein